MRKIIINLIRMALTVFLIVMMYSHLNFIGLVLIVVAINLLFEYAVRNTNA